MGELDSAERRLGRALLLAFGDIGGWMEAVRNPAPSGPAPRWSAQTARAWDREFQRPEDKRNAGLVDYYGALVPDAELRR